MNDPILRFPLTCPQCGTESLAALHIVAVTIAVKNWRSMRLYSPCHDIFWDASAVELDQIDAYLGASWLGAVPKWVPYGSAEHSAVTYGGSLRILEPEESEA